MARTLEVKITGDASRLDKTYSSASRSTSKFGKSFGGLKTGVFAAAGALAGAAVVVGSWINKATEAQVVQKQMIAQLDASGLSYEKYAKTIDTVITKQSMLAGQDDEELTQAFTNVVRVTEDVDKGLRGMAIASDLAAARGMDLSKAGELVGKVYAGKITSLSRYGIVLGKNATVQEALLALEKKFGGQAEASATAQAKLGVVWENLQEKLGAKLLPLFERFSNWLIANMPAIEAAVGQAFRAIGDAVEIGREAFEKIQPFVEAFMRQIEGFVQLVKGIFTGDWSLAWEGMKNIAGGAMDVVKGYLNLLKNAIAGFAATALAPFRNAFDAAKTWVSEKLDQIVGFFTALPGRIAATFASLAEIALAPFQAAFTTAKTWVGARIDDIAQFFTRLPSRILATLTDLKDTALAPFRKAFEVMSGAVETALDKITTVIGIIKLGVKWLGKEAVDILNAVIGPFERIGAALAAALQPLADMIGSIAGGLREIIDLMKAIGGFVGGIFGGGGAPDPGPGSKGGRIPKGATGAIVNRPTLALIGEAGAEAVVPLDQTAGNSPLPGRLGGTTINVYVPGLVGSKEQIIDAVHQGLLRKQGRTTSLGFS